jgi:ABC-2 type transport system ATP-binding protein
MINVAALSKTFRNTKAVNELSFAVQPGEVLGLLGPNGAGKTTTLRSLAGVLRPDQGTITIGEFDISKSPVEAKRLLAYLADQPTFFDNLTCWEHIRFVASVHGVADFENKARVLFERLELSEKKDAFASDLSKGMRQRLGLICSLLHAPKVLLFDEPMTGLDPKGIRALNDIIREEASRGTSVILSSHLLSILEEVCTKVLVMDRGQSKLYGTLSEVRAMGKDLGKDASLEEMFFYATKNRDVA